MPINSVFNGKNTIRPTDIAIWNASMKLVTEPGTFDVMIARDAEHILLKKQLEYKD